MSYNYFEELDDVHREHYNRKLCASGLEMCPYKVHADTWTNDPMKWPTVEYGDIYNYLIESPKLFSREKMKNYKSLEAHNYFKDGWVQTVFHMKSDTGNFIFISKVMPSQRVTEEPHKPWVAVSKDGTVVSGHCNCMAGLGETCSHVAALLFKIEAAVRLGFTTSSCSSVACSWNATFTKNVSAAAVSDIQFFKENYGEKSAKKAKIVPTLSQQELETFLIGLKSVCPKSVLLSAYSNHCDTFVDNNVNIDDSFPVDLRSHYVENLTNSDLDAKSSELLAKLYDVTKSQCDNVQKCTIGQSSSPQWFRFRAGRITSSTSHNILRTSLDNPSKSAVLAVTKLGTKSAGGPAMKHGNSYESKAVNECFNEVKKTHKNVSLNKTGLIISRDMPFVSATPDFLLSCECCGDWVGEVKCPYTYKDVNVSEITDPSFYLHNGTLRKNHQYYTQVQMHMYCANVDKCIFGVWTFKGCHVIKIARDENFIKVAVDDLSEKFKRIILPELLTRNLEHGEISVKTKENKTLYCFCKGEETEDMIGCDNPNCSTGNQWFHFSCVKIKRPPKGRWLCPNCKKNRSK